jgi:putative glutamine transport system substrate-binding protein
MSAVRWLRNFVTLLCAANLLLGGIAILPAFAQSTPQAKFPPDSYAAKIVQRGKLVAGVKYDVPLYGYLNPKTGELEGFEVDIAREIARALFGEPNRVEFKQTVARTRIPMLQEGVVDLVIATMTQTKERMNEIDFSDMYYLAGQAVLVPDKSPIKRLDDLHGKILTAAKGGTSDKTAREMFPDAKMLLFDTQAECFEALGSRADAYVSDDSILQGMQKKAPGFRLLPTKLSFEPYAIGYKKGHPEFVAFVNTVFAQMKANGKWKELYLKNIGGEAPEVPPAKPEAQWLR